MERNHIINYLNVGKTFLVHNGKKFIKISINKSMVGFKAGEFVFTRRLVKNIHKK